ncbi:MAG: alpha/beta hydrolase-fold protein, partial [Acidimicrobiales bacterium]
SGPAASTWPAGAGISAPAAQDFLVVSGTGAWLVGTAGTATPVGDLGGTLSVDTAAAAFIVSLPDQVLQPSGTWQVRLVAGLANSADDGFAAVPAADGAAPGQPNVYDVGFRTYQQEAPQLNPAGGPDPAGATSAATALGSASGVITDDNFWMDGAQATALAAGTVAPFAATVDWSALAAGTTTPSPRPTGWTDRWYVSTQDFGPGVSATSTQVEPNLLGRAQPYGIYVPTGYQPTQPAPLTFLLHSLDVNLNQYAVLDPRQIQEACEERGSICVTPESRGLAGWYQGYAEVDFWQTWHAVAASYSLDPSRTVLSGFSMGGYGTYQLGLEYPDLFAGAVALSAPPVCGIRVVQGADADAGGGECTVAGDTGPLVGNARWLPYVIEQGVADELVPVTGAVQQVQLFDQDGLRNVFELYPAEDHLVNATQDGFRSEYRAIGSPTVAVDPGSVDFTWYPVEDQPDLGIGPTGDYWVQGLQSAGSAAGQLASVHASSGERPEPAVTVERTTSAEPAAQPTPRTTSTLQWVLGATPVPVPTLVAAFTDVAAATLETATAGFPPGTTGSGNVSADGPLVLTLAQLAPGTALVVDHHPAGLAGGDGTVAVRLPAGDHTVSWSAPGPGTRRPAGSR